MDKLLTGLATLFYGAFALICNPFFMIVTALIDFRITLFQIAIAVAGVVLSTLVGVVAATLTKLKGA